MSQWKERKISKMRLLLMTSVGRLGLKVIRVVLEDPRRVRKYRRSRRLLLRREMLSLLLLNLMWKIRRVLKKQLEPYKCRRPRAARQQWLLNQKLDHEVAQRRPPPLQEILPVAQLLVHQEQEQRCYHRVLFMRH